LISGNTRIVRRQLPIFCDIRALYLESAEGVHVSSVDRVEDSRIKPIKNDSGEGSHEASLLHRSLARSDS